MYGKLIDWQGDEAEFWVSSQGFDMMIRCRATLELTFGVEGDVTPQGSMTPFCVWRPGQTHRPRVGVRPSNAARLYEWRDHVKYAASKYWGGRDPIDGPVIVFATFKLRRPKKHFRTGSKAHELRLDSPLFHIQAPDADKLMRAIGDALSGTVYIDDAQSVTVVPVKEWTGSTTSSVEVTVVSMPEPSRAADLFASPRGSNQ